MAEKPGPDPLPQAIMDAERFVEDLMNDTRHPVHNRADPRHQQSVMALEALMRRLDAMRNAWLAKD